MSSVKWNQGFGSVFGSEGANSSAGYVLDVVTSSGSTQMNLSTVWPVPDDELALTQANADATAAALQSAVNSLSGVISSVLTPFSVQGPAGTVNPTPNVSLFYDADSYACFLFTLTVPSEFGSTLSAQLISASPADGKLSAANLATVTTALVTFIETLPTVTACTVAQQVIVPGTATTFAPVAPGPAFTAVGPPISPTVSSKTFTLAPGAVGDFILFGVICTATTADWATALSSSNVTWSALGSHFASGGSGNNVTEQLFLGKVTAASSAVVTITTNAGSPVIRAGGQEFSTTAGFSAVALDASGTIDGAASGKFPPVTPARAGDLYWSFIYDNGVGVVGTTSGYTYHLDSNGNLQAYCLSCADTSQQPNIGDTNGTSGIGVMLFA
jgi:hypothetical protein